MSDDAREPFWTGLLDIPVAAPVGGSLAPPEGGGALRVSDTDIDAVARAGDPATPLPLAVVLTGGAGQVAGPAARCARDDAVDLRRLEVALRDPGDLAGNARRVVAAVDAARAEGALADGVAVHVAVPDDPGGSPSHGWLAAADELAAAELGLVLTSEGPAPVVVARIDAALDRETPFTGAVAGPEALLALLAATTLAFDGDREAAVAALGPDGGPESSRGAASLVRARRWLRAAHVPDPATALASFRELAP